MSEIFLKKMVTAEIWAQYSARLQNEETAQVLHELFDLIVDTLGNRIDKIQLFEDKALMFFSAGREILRINIGRRNMRIYVHPPAGALFETKSRFEVEKISLWGSSFRKTSGKYCGISFWVSEMKHLIGAKEILNSIPSKRSGN